MLHGFLASKSLFALSIGFLLSSSACFVGSSTALLIFLGTKCLVPSTGFLSSLFNSLVGSAGAFEFRSFGPFKLGFELGSTFGLELGSTFGLELEAGSCFPTPLLSALLPDGRDPVDGLKMLGFKIKKK